MAETGNVILDGRDIGTVVLPHADLKNLSNSKCRNTCEETLFRK